MRTTLSIDDDVLEAVKARARREGRTAGEVLSDLARRQLTRPVETSVRTRSGLPALPPRGGIVTDDLVERLRDEEGV